MDTQTKIMDIFVSVLNISPEQMGQIAQDDPLNAIGMDSINCVDLVLTIEEEFDVAFRDEELLLDNLNTINKLCRIVEEKLKIS